MQFELTIDSVQYHPKAGSVHVSKTANGRATASFTLISEDRSYRPPLDGEVIIEVEGVKVFAGLINQPHERGVLRGTHPGIATTVSASDYNAYASRRYVAETIAAGTLKSALTTLVTYLSGYGVTLHASQVDGPNVPELEWDYSRLDEVLNRYMALTADAGEPYVWRIDHDKVLRAYQPSTQAAPFNLVGDVLTQVVGDIEVTQARGEYANRVILRVPDQIIEKYQETRMGDGIWDSWTLTYPIHQHYNFVNGNPNGVYDPAGGFWGPLGEGHPTGPTWIIESDNQTITNVVSTPPAGYAITITYDGLLEITASAEDAAEIAAHGIWEKVIVLDKIPSDTTAQAIVDSELAKRVYAERIVRYHTTELGVEPGQTQTITVSSRNLNSTAVITDVVIRDWGPRLLLHQVTAAVDSAQTNLDRGWRDVYRVWAGDKSGSARTAPAVGAGVPQIVAAHPPDKSVQVNREGAFGGDAAFIYYEDENSLVCGENCAITAGVFAECQVFGRGNTISDP